MRFADQPCSLDQCLRLMLCQLHVDTPAEQQVQESQDVSRAPQLWNGSRILLLRMCNSALFLCTRTDLPVWFQPFLRLLHDDASYKKTILATIQG